MTEFQNNNVDWPFSGMSVSRAIAARLERICLERRPRCIVDVGTGEGGSLSVFVRSASPDATIWTIDDQPTFFHVARERLKLLGLTDERVRFIHAPIELGEWSKIRTAWYKHEALAEIQGPIDLLFVDGPKGQYDRFPALPEFYERLRRPAVIVLDDCNRDRERKAFNEWIAFLRNKGDVVHVMIHDFQRTLGEVELQ